MSGRDNWDYFVQERPEYAERAKRLLEELGLGERAEAFRVDVRVTPMGGVGMGQTGPTVTLSNVMDSRMGLHGMRYTASRMLDEIIDGITKREPAQ